MKYAWIEAPAGWQPIARLCNVLGVSRSAFLQWRERGPSDRELANRALEAQVAVIHGEGKPGYGRIRVTPRLRQSGRRVGAERVRKSLLGQSLRSVYRKKYRVTTDSNPRQPVAQNLLDRRFDGWLPHQAWRSDIPYLLTDESRLLDCGCTRIAAAQYASDNYRKLVKQFHRVQSMSRKGNCWDTAPMESFIKTLKVERISTAIHLARSGKT